MDNQKQLEVTGGGEMNKAFKQVDAVNIIAAKAAQLQGLLVMATGEGFEQFSNMTEELQHNTLFLAAEMAGEIGLLVSGIKPAVSTFGPEHSVKAPNALELAQEVENSIVARDAALDITEIVGHLDLSAGLLANAEQSFVDIGAIFDAIVAAAPAGSLTSRLASLGSTVTENLEGDYRQYSATCMAHIERYSAAIDGDPFRRLVTTEDS